MVRNFKGVVKVSEVQEEFDNLLNTINDKIDTYNSSLNIEDVDYNNGGTDLAPYGYTLSVGGLKKVLDAYDGAILGANILRVGTNQYLISEGIYIKDREVYRLPSKPLSGTGKTVYYNPTTNEYTFDSESAGYLYPNNLGKIVFPAGTYPVTSFDSEYNKTNTTVTFNETQAIDCYISNITSNHMQNSNCKFTVYASYSGQYDYSSLVPSCLIDPNSAQYNDVYLANLSGVADVNREYFTSEIPQNLNFGSLWVYGIKAEYTFSETPSSQTMYLSAQPGDTRWDPFYGWKLQAFAYDENDNLLVTGTVNTGGQYTSYATLSSLPASTRKIIVCAISPDSWMYDTVGNLYRKGCGLRISNLYNVEYINQDIDCCLNYYESEGAYDISHYLEDYNTLLGSVHFTANTNTLEYIQLSEGGISIGNVLVSKINPNRISKLCNTQNAVNESIPDYKVTIESKNSGYVMNGNQYLSNSDKGQFYSGSAGRNCRINLFDTQVAYHQWHGDRTDSYHEPFNFMFIPKGIPNPYNGLAGEVRFAIQKVWNYILQRPSR